MQDVALDHISLAVLDAAASADFYCRVFGFAVTRATENPSRLFWLGVEGRDVIHLTQQANVTAPQSRQNHVALRVPHFDLFVAHLNNIGVGFVDWAGNPGKINVHSLGFRQVYFRDPDGYLVEANDRNA